MKRLLLSTAAIAGLAMIANPAAAQVKLELGGYFKGYGAYVDQDETAGTEASDVDFIRDTEVHFGGETTLDNGLTVGAHIEVNADATQSTLTDADGDGTVDAGDTLTFGDNFSVDESYIYMSGGWGRFNVGAEDGAGYLLQVAAPSADSNIDGIRQYVQPVNYTVLTGALLGAAAVNGSGIDYDMDPSGKSDKITYLSPILNGFQAGVSFSPDTDAADSLAGIGTNNVEDTVDETYEAAVRYEGQFNNVGMILGGGYSHGENGADAVAAVNSDDRKVWNVGADFDIGPFGVGAIYREDNGGVEGAGSKDEDTMVVGVDYTAGPFKLGASYYDQDNTFATPNLDTKRYSGGVTYTYGPGMTFRGSVGYIEHELGAADADATYVTLGTQINF